MPEATKIKIETLPEPVKAFVGRLEEFFGFGGIDCFGDSHEIDIFIRGREKAASVVIRMSSRGGWHIMCANIAIPVVAVIREHFPEFTTV